MPNRTPCIDCDLVELRQYTLHPGQRDVLVALFDRAFVETQEALGMAVMGQFRDADDADRFVWLRGFADRAARHAGLAAFYGGPVWREHRAAANATMIDSDDVRLLRPAWPGSGIAMAGRERAAAGAARRPSGVLGVTILPLREPAPDALRSACRRLVPEVGRTGALTQAWYVSETARNDFPALPVREGEPVLVLAALHLDETAAATARDGIDAALSTLAPWLAGPAKTRRLLPTARSALHA